MFLFFLIFLPKRGKKTERWEKKKNKKIVCVWVLCCCCAAVTSAGWPPCVCRVTDDVSHGVFGIPLIHTEKTERRRRKDDILLRRAWETSQVSDRRRRCRRRRRFFVGLAPSSDDSLETLKERERRWKEEIIKKGGK